MANARACLTSLAHSASSSRQASMGTLDHRQRSPVLSKPPLNRDWRYLCCQKIGEAFSSSIEIRRNNLPAGNFGQPQPSRVRQFIYVRNGQSTVGGPNGPKWTSSGHSRPKWTILVHFGLANANIQFGIRSFWPNWSFGPLWTILVQYTFRQYRGHSLLWARGLF